METAIENWRRAQAVCFDVDSTVTVGEGIDELADFCGVGEAVAQWCRLIFPRSSA
jgi:phosphoserine phosphatase